MNSLIEKLTSICPNHLWQEKILLVDTHSIGEQIIAQYVKEGNHAINLKIKTVRDLALEAIDQSYEYINTAIGTQLIYTIMKSLKNDNALLYFQELEVSLTFSQHLYGIIEELRLNGITSTTLNQQAFVTKEKGQDLCLILSNYEKLLKAYELKDDLNLYEEAINTRKQSERIYFIQNNLTLSFLQEKFLEFFLHGENYYLPLAPVYGVTPPKQTKLSKITKGRETALSYIYQQNKQIDQPLNLKLFTAKTEESELKEVIYEIKQKNLFFDECTILYTKPNPYVTTMFHLSEALKLPVTFSEGVPITFTCPGKLLQLLLQWIKHNYCVSDFIPILQERLLQMEGNPLSPNKWTKILRNANIGWDQQRYLTMLKKEREEILNKCAMEANPEKKAYFEQLSEDYSVIFHWFQSVFKMLPSAIGNKAFFYRDLLIGCQHLIENYCRVKSSVDHAAKEAIIEKIEQILPYSNEKISLNEAIINLSEWLLSIQVGASSPKPGHIHVSSYNNGLYINRKYLFIVGLDNQRFPGGNSENPLLLDIERKKIGNSIPLLQEQSRKKMYYMLQTLASSNSKITLSYCQFDVNENRSVSPSYLFLQCFRLLTGNSGANYKDLSNELPVKAPCTILDFKDFWTAKLQTTHEKQLDFSINQQFPNLTSGLTAEMMKQDMTFTIFDGKIGNVAAELDPRNNPNKKMTAGKLELLAKCPYAYFLQEVIGIKPIEELNYNPNRWLDAPTRGSLLHEIFEIFYKKLIERQEKPSVRKHLSNIKELAMTSLANIKEKMPPPNAKVELQETEEIIESCETFLQGEEENCETGTPSHFEYSFGIGNNLPAIITLPTGSFQLSGKIDRIDQMNDGTFHIIDYKTGSTWGYEDHHFFKGGRQLQHLLYALALENHLSLSEGIVKKSSYLFPTKKGLGQAYERLQDEVTRTNGRDILERLLSILEHGHFTMTDDSKDCQYCDYQLICRRSTYDKDIFENKQQDPEAVGVRNFKGVRSYD